VRKAWMANERCETARANLTATNVLVTIEL
jgi:hypothetical protein